MAVLISKQNGNFTDSGTWLVAEPNSFLDSESANTALTTSLQYSNTFGLTGNISGIAVKIADIDGAVGSLSLALYDNSSVYINNTSGTINLSDISNTNANATYNRGWYNFIYPSPVTLNGTYKLGVVKSATASAMTLYSSATTNWARIIALASGKVPASGDLIHVVGYFTGQAPALPTTVNYNHTGSLTFGTGVLLQSISVGKSGILDWSTGQNTYLNWRGGFFVLDGGTLNMGTSGAPINSGYSGVLEMNCTAAGDTYLQSHYGGTINIYGSPKLGMANLTGVIMVGTSGITVTSNSGWGVGDAIAIAPSDVTLDRYESGYISSLIDSTGVIFNRPLTYSHSGVDVIECEVINITRNVKIFSTSPSLCGYISCYGTMNLDNVELYNLGSNNTAKKGIYINNNWSYSYPITNINNCSFRDWFVAGTIGVEYTQSTYGYTNHRFTNNVIYNLAGMGLYVNAGLATAVVYPNFLISGNTFIKTTSYMIRLDEGRVNVKNNVFSANPSNAAIFCDTSYGIYNIENIKIHNNAAGIYLYRTNILYNPIKNIKAWFYGGRTLRFDYCSNITLDGLTLFGNYDYVFNFFVFNRDFIIKNLIFEGSHPQLGGSSVFQGCVQNLVFENCRFGPNIILSGLLTVSDCIRMVSIGGMSIPASCSFKNCTFNPLMTLINGQQYIAPGYEISSTNHNQINGNNYIWKGQGTISPDTGYFYSTSPAIRLTPLPAETCWTGDLQSSRYYVPVDSGQTASCSVRVYFSTGSNEIYNGPFPTLWMERNPMLGWNNNLCLATGTVACSGNWELLSGNSLTSDRDGIAAFFVSCGGLNYSTGFCLIDNWV